jgi:5'-3' exonuclease
MRVYRQELPGLGGYLVHGANVNLSRVEAFIRKIGAFEDIIFSKRMRELRRQKERLARQKAVGGFVSSRPRKKGFDKLQGMSPGGITHLIPII